MSGYKFSSQKESQADASSPKSRSVTDVVTQKNKGKGTIYFHQIIPKKQPVYDEYGQCSGDVDMMTHSVYSESNSVEGEGDIHLIKLPNGEVVIYRVIGVEDWSLPRVLRKGMDFNPVFKISRAGLGLIQSLIGNPVGANDFNKDMDGESLTPLDQVFNIGDGVITIALAQTKVVKYLYGGTKLAYASDKSNLNKFNRYSSLPVNVREAVKTNVFDKYFKLGSTVIELERME